MNFDSKTGLVHEWSLLCRSSAIDKDSGALSLFNVVDRLVVNKEHFEKHFEKQKEAEGESRKGFVIPTEFEIITMWSKSGFEPLSLETKTEIFDPQGDSLLRFSYNIFLKEGRRKRRNRSKVKGFKITGEGLYVINLSIRKDEGEEYRPISRTTLDVMLRDLDKPETLSA
ncbi:MAG: hypothetical protein ACLFTS_03415 [Candidatus Paceibacterota bacterium]